MAIAQDPLSNPSNQMKVLEKPMVDSTLGEALETAGKVGGAIAQSMFDRRTAEVAQAFDTDVETIVFGDVLKRAQEDDPEAQPGSVPLHQDPTLKGYANRADQIEQAAAQGRLSGGAKLDRLNALVKEYVSIYPERADDIREHASSKLGFSPEHRLISKALEAGDEESKRQAAIKNTLVQDAAKIGAVFMRPDGSFDEERMATAATVSNQLKQELDLQKQLKEVNRADPNTSIVVANKQARFDWENTIGSSVSQFKAIAAQAPDFTAGPEQVAELRTNLMASGQQTISNITTKLTMANYTPEEIKQVTAPLEKELTDSVNLIDANIKETADVLTLIQNKMKINEAQALPLLTTLKSVFGPEAISMNNTEITSLFGDKRVISEMQVALNGMHSLDPAQHNSLLEVLKMAKADGTFSWASLNPDQASNTIKTSLKVAKGYELAPNATTPTGRNSWTNINGQLISASLITLNPQDTKNSMEYFGTPQWRAMFDQVANDPAQKDKANALADGVRNVAVRNMTFNASEATKQIAELEGLVSITYNPGTGKYDFTPNLTALEAAQKKSSVQFRGEINAPSMLANTQIVKAEKLVNTLNSSLDTVAHLKTYDSGLKDLEDLQVREIFARSMPIGFTPGANSTLPEGANLESEDRRILDKAEEFRQSVENLRQSLTSIQGGGGAVQQGFTQVMQKINRDNSPPANAAPAAQRRFRYNPSTDSLEEVQ